MAVMDPDTLVDELGDDLELAGDVELPKSQQRASSPQRLLVAVLSDLRGAGEIRLPSAALVQLLGEFGVSAVGARSALSRLGRRGLLVSTKTGRNTSYGLSPEAAAHIARNTRRVLTFGDADPVWDGRWRIVVFSLPENQRDVRYLLRCRLRNLGFAPLFDGTWVSPTASPDDASQVLGELAIDTATVVTADGVQHYAGGRSLVEAWDVDVLRATYEGFIAEAEQLVGPAVNRLTPTAALVARTDLMQRYRRFPGLDPRLPLELMPADWPRTRARELFLRAYDDLAPLAQISLRSIVAEFDPDVALTVEMPTTSELMERSRV